MTNGQFRPTGFRILPPVVKNLLIINGLFYLATFALGSAFRIDITDYLGLRYWGSETFSPFQLVTYMFLHSSRDFSHILFNMFALWMFGNTLENVWGPKRFLTYYMITGIGAGIVQMIVAYFRIKSLEKGLSPEMINLVYNQGLQIGRAYPEAAIRMYQIVNTTTVGASGAVFGLLLAFGMMFPNALIYLYFAIPIKAKWFVIIYGAIELYLGFANNAGDNVAHFAHLGGMIFGFFLIKYWKRN